MRYTIFPDRWAKSQSRHEASFDELATLFSNPSLYPAKSLCPWIKFGVFGDLRSAKGSLRTNRNLISVSATEGDYDLGVMSIDQAADLARAAGLRCILYTSGSHTPSAPRWRVIAPLEREHPRSDRRALMERLNGIFGGVLSRESFTDSQAYYFGRIIGTDYQCRII